MAYFLFVHAYAAGLVELWPEHGAEISEVASRVMGDELRMAQAQIAESERMLESNIRHNRRQYGHELATLHMNLQILEQQAGRLELSDDIVAPLERSRDASRKMFAVLDEIVSLRQVPAHFYDALTDLVDQRQPCQETLWMRR